MSFSARKHMYFKYVAASRLLWEIWLKEISHVVATGFFDVV